MTFLPMHLPVISISYNIWMLQLLHPILHPTCNLFVCSLHPICLLLLGASSILFQLASYLLAGYPPLSTYYYCYLLSSPNCCCFPNCGC